MLSESGFSHYEVNYGMTMRERDVILLTIARRELVKQQQFAMAVMAGAGALFSKDGLGALSKVIDREDRRIEELTGKRLGVDSETLASERAEASRQAMQARKDAYSEEDLKATVRKLDNVVSRLTGQIQRNEFAYQ